ncbi:hypothetical protein SDC9_206001 [bioreactor metagenome]|uniref:Uncharacterized protein n=1 Tax=bioreactor metagenome TaxID=1076179 RepID=A0A645J3R9_9ZZZZ
MVCVKHGGHPCADRLSTLYDETAPRLLGGQPDECQPHAHLPGGTGGGEWVGSPAEQLRRHAGTVVGEN